MVTLLLKNVINFQAGSHQFSSHICFLVILANSALGHNVALGIFQRLFCPVLPLQSLKYKTFQAVFGGNVDLTLF